ncbi:hypothetical protein [Actinotalea ferrariae]|nr:hypothetical protein [Actinotalea ferrariae]
MALKESDLDSSLSSSADELCGRMDASQCEDYVPTLLFVKCVSHKAKADPYAVIEVPGDGWFDYRITRMGKSDVGEEVNVAIRRLVEADGLQGVVNSADFGDSTELGSRNGFQDKVSNLTGIFQDRKRLVALMDRFLSDWRQRRDELNEVPLAQESWI